VGPARSLSCGASTSAKRHRGPNRPVGGAPKRSAKTGFRTWRSNANRMRDPWHADTMECDTFNRFFGAEHRPAATLTPMSDIPGFQLYRWLDGRSRKMRCCLPRLSCSGGTCHNVGCLTAQQASASQFHAIDRVAVPSLRLGIGPWPRCSASRSHSLGSADSVLRRGPTERRRGSTTIEFGFRYSRQLGLEEQIAPPRSVALRFGINQLLDAASC